MHFFLDHQQAHCPVYAEKDFCYNHRRNILKHYFAKQIRRSPLSIHNTYLPTILIKIHISVVNLKPVFQSGCFIMIFKFPVSHTHTF